nr:ribonuclease H-like domain-containing protein [Tanacetum cinerariifolium]
MSNVTNYVAAGPSNPSMALTNEQMLKLMSLLNEKSIPTTNANMAAKQTRERFPLSDHKSVHVGELVHLDVWGPYKVTSRESFKSPNDEGRVSSSDTDHHHSSEDDSDDVSSDTSIDEETHPEGNFGTFPSDEDSATHDISKSKTNSDRDSIESP